MMQYLWKVVMKIYVRFREAEEFWADDEKSPPEWADPVLWKRSLMQ